MKGGARAAPRFPRGIVRRISALCAVLASFAGCTGEELPWPCAAPEGPTREWRSARYIHFTLQVPPGYSGARRRVGDTWLMRFEAAGGPGHLQLNYGPHVNTLEQVGHVFDRYRRCDRAIAGRPATLLVARRREAQDGNRFVVAAAWRDVEPGTALGVWAEAPRLAEARDALRAIYSLNIGTQLAPGPSAPPALP